MIEASHDGSCTYFSFSACALLEYGVHGIISYTDCVSAYMLEDLLAENDIPVILSTFPDCSLLQPNGIVQMGADDYTLALYDFYNIHGASAEVILYDRFTGMSFIKSN